MTTTTPKYSMGFTARAAAAFTAVLLAGCMDLTNVPNYDNESLAALVNDPTPARISTASQGMLRAIRSGMVGGFSVLTRVNFMGREGYNLDPATPGLVPENMVGPLGPESANSWPDHYRAIKLGDVILAGLNNVSGMTDPQKEATRGFVKTMQAYQYHMLILVHDQAGAVLQVDVDPIGGAAAPIATRAEVYTKITQLLDQARTNLLAGGTAFPFTLTPGFASLNTPATFLQFNRALRARVDVHRSTLLGEARWNEALLALGQSFLTTTGLPGSLTTGVYHSYSTASGDLSNSSYDPTGRALLGHPSIEGRWNSTRTALVATNYQLKPDATPDARFTSKVGFRLVSGVRTPVSQSGISSDLIVRVFTSNSSPLAIIRNEDLILLRAEARLATGDRTGALADLNLIRVNSGGLAAMADPGSDPPVFDDIVYNRRYSLFYEGWRWVDMRRWGRLAQLEQDLTSHRIFRYNPLPLAECTVRSPAPAGCAAEAGVTGIRQ
ncbi:MAG: RagB/SusD family nutrient uptake outer membrane protein [Gemmatimonadetes bacterium]|nr:RagB/SusD family nutrient uptake outer membrane protein [Gemmatimonadota bacterium]